MSTKVKEKGGDFEELPAGTHPAYCCAVVDLGLQDSPFGVKEQVVLRFETPLKKLTKGDHAGEPFTIWAFYTASLSKRANLRRDLEAWRSKAFTADELEGFDLKNVLGKPCTIVVSESESGKMRITGVSARMDGVELPPMHNPPLWFDLDEHGTSSAEYEAVPEWLREFIDKRLDPADLEGAGHEPSENPAPAGFDDDIPFAWAIALPVAAGMAGLADAAQAVLL